MQTIKKHWFLWSISAVLAFALGLLVNFPAAIAYDKFKPELPKQVSNLLSDVTGSVWNGQATLSEGPLKTQVSWVLSPASFFTNDPTIKLYLTEIGHNLKVELTPQNDANGQVDISGLINSRFVNQQLKTNGIRISSDISVNELQVTVVDRQFSAASGTITWPGGTVGYNYPDVKNIQMPELTGALSVNGGALVIAITQTGKSTGISTLTFKLDGWVGVEVKPEMADLILLPNRRVNRAGNVMEIKRKLF